MSRTDVHRPWSVILADPYMRHRFYRYGDYKGEQLYAPYKNISCGCRMCTNHYGRKWNTRSIRVASRATCRDAVKVVDRSDFDGYVEPRGRY